MFTFESRELELDELELTPKRDARLDAELELLTALEELSLRALLLIRDEKLEEELLELEEEDELTFLWRGTRSFLSFIKPCLPSTISSLGLMCLISFSAAFGPI